MVINEFLLIGGFCLGVAIGWLVVHFIHRFEVFNAQVLTAVVSVVAGGTVTVFLGTNGQSAKAFPWVGYCVGLGFAVVSFGAFGLGTPKSQIKPQAPPEAKDSRLRMLDELYERKERGQIDIVEYGLAKERILADINSHPSPGG